MSDSWPKTSNGNWNNLTHGGGMYECMVNGSKKSFSAPTQTYQSSYDAEISLIHL